jgi:hypothetical protein
MAGFLTITICPVNFWCIHQKNDNYERLSKKADAFFHINISKTQVPESESSEIEDLQLC